MRNLAGWIRRERLRCNLHQRDVAAVVEVDAGTVSRWERGRGGPTLDQFRTLCMVFEASADAALGLPRRMRARRARPRVSAAQA